MENLKDQMEKEGIKRISPSDPEAKLLRGRDGKYPGYNVQIAVDAEHKMIANSEVYTDANDLYLLPKVMESIKEEYEEITR